ncbi:MAG: hypothetical protein J6Y92_02485 [Lentisphaeria bacterium]|nr:hypothetical protein [Lentisphaeria bacterium]
MGLRTRKIHALSLLLLLAAFGTGALLLAQDLSSGSYTVLKRYVYPRYNGKNEIEYLVYGKTAVNKGSLINLTSPMIDLVDGSYTSIRQIDTIKASELYPEPYQLGSKLRTIQRFWTSSHHRHSQAWIFADEAVFDKSTNVLTSDDAAHFRSRQLDADGVGFDADNDRKFIHIRSNVRVVLRLKNKKIAVEEPESQPQPEKEETKQ